MVSFTTSVLISPSACEETGEIPASSEIALFSLVDVVVVVAIREDMRTLLTYMSQEGEMERSEAA